MDRWTEGVREFAGHTIVAAQDELEDTVQPEQVQEMPRQRSDRSAGLFPSV